MITMILCLQVLRLTGAQKYITKMTEIISALLHMIGYHLVGAIPGTS